MDRDNPAVDDTAIRDLDARLHGDALGPADGDYRAARTVWNAMVDRYPAVVVRPADTNDVVVAVEFARRHGLSLAVQGGGHNVAGNGVCDGGLLLDCSLLTAVEVDVETRTARVEPGVTVGEFDRATQAHGLATPSGIVSTTGVAGLTLGGGWGWLSRSHGLAIDNLRAVEIVTADGAVRHASDDEHADLFWGLRGGGGNFGVVTAFEFALHEVGPTVLAGVLAYPFEAAGDLLRFHREFTASAPEELCCYASVRTAPSASFVPADIRGERIVTAYLCYAGPIEDGERAIRPLREFREPLVDLVEPRRYTAFQGLFDDVYPPGYRNYWKSQFVGEAGLSDEAIETLVEYANAVTSPYTSIVIEHLGGAISRPDSGASAYPHRDAGYSFNIFTRWADADEDDEHIAWTRAFFAAIAPNLSDGVYVNFLSREGNERVRAAFGDNYDRLVELKRRYDPENLFRVNQNIAP
ncbi:FAD-binding oxidoreductase [Haloferax marisrubri]|uniref:FAD-binding oxidoreductase n=1 Tax=Haloferax marisrubri TaxID=1544719 RepID=A0A2P4NKQ0_9EURY|nr:FAD-binding oxidoreductase [Haloferax marisrubri]POG53690.1 FAD-binding oxidoreductase [Haloferax marisrubri]